MVIYVDILILVNFAVDYFLLKAAAAAVKTFVPVWRMILSAFAASFFSLYILLPRQHIFVQLLCRTAFCAVIILCAFGFKGKVAFIRNTAVFFGITVTYAGCMAAVYTLFRPAGLAVKNGVVYIGISPLVLILSSAAFYILLRTGEYIAARRRTVSTACGVTLYIGGCEKSFFGLIDTGNNLTDPFSESGVIIVNENDVMPLITAAGGSEQSRFCLLPCKTVSGSALLKGYRLDRAVVTANKNNTVLAKPIAAFADTPLEKDAALVNPAQLDL